MLLLWYRTASGKETLLEMLTIIPQSSKELWKNPQHGEDKHQPAKKVNGEVGKP